MLLNSAIQSQAVPRICFPQGGVTDWCLLDHGVHGRDALGHDQRLAVGDVVEGRARVTGQNHLGEGARRGHTVRLWHSRHLDYSQFGREVSCWWAVTPASSYPNSTGIRKEITHLSPSRKELSDKRKDS